MRSSPRIAFSPTVDPVSPRASASAESALAEARGETKTERNPVISVDDRFALICRGFEAFSPDDEFRKKLERSDKAGKPLRVKYGIDPPGIDVHLGNTVPLRKLRLFQELGH